jgi:hypothetical protein
MLWEERVFSRKRQMVAPIPACRKRDATVCCDGYPPHPSSLVVVWIILKGSSSVAICALQVDVKNTTKEVKVIYISDKENFGISTRFSGVKITDNCDLLCDFPV